MSVLTPVASDPDLTDEQEQVMAEIDDFMADQHRQLFTLHGYAGTGKTTLLGHVARQYRHDALCCLTGKAASVLREKTQLDACTVHSYFYQLMKAEKDEFGRKHLTFAPRHSSAELTGDVVLLDECSMISQAIGQQLLKTGAKVLAVGDPGQLPPINEPIGFFGEADATLETIHRQAAESPIIRQATLVRQGKRYRDDGDAFQIARRLTDEMLVQADVVLCQRNLTRQAINQMRRKLAGHTAPFPEAGEPLLCLKNAHRFKVFNGGIYVLAITFEPNDAEIHVWVDGRIVTIPNAAFVGLTGADDNDDDELPATTEFDYGYCLTVHKAQGSEWPRVVLIDEYSRAEQRREWQYTGITRAAQSIVVVPR
jgi:exodeoxyribonuclease-5